MKKIIKVKDSDGSIREVDLNDPSNFHEAMKKIIKVKDSDGSIREVDLNDPSKFHETKGVGSDAEMVFMGILILILLCKLFYHWVTGTP